MTEAIKDVPSAALQFDAGVELEFMDGDDPKRASITMLARTPEPINHWWWGRVVHDLSGMTLRKASCIIDWCHNARWNADDILGAADEFDPNTKRGLTIKGELFSTKEDDRAQDIIAKGRAGVPLESSIDFNGPGIVVEEIGEGASTTVNGKTFEGPGHVIRKWPLRSVAVCPYGADSGTTSSFSEGDAADADAKVAVKFLTAEQTMPKPKTKTDTTTEAGELNDDGNTKPETETKTELTEKPKKPAASGDDASNAFRAELNRFTETFGAENGAEWFSQSLSFEDALGNHCRHLETELAARDKTIGELNEKLASLNPGENEAVESGDGSAGGDCKTSFTSLFNVKSRKKD